MTAIRREARAANAEQLQATGQRLTEADHARAQELRALLATRRKAGAAAPREVSFEEALAAVLSGPTATAQPPKQ
jgi:hypothetical protein